jgi:hypothetical protein
MEGLFSFIHLYLYIRGNLIADFSEATLSLLFELKFFFLCINSPLERKKNTGELLSVFWGAVYSKTHIALIRGNETGALFVLSVLSGSPNI